jgi:DNA recombination protein RmuC
MDHLALPGLENVPALTIVIGGAAVIAAIALLLLAVAFMRSARAHAADAELREALGLEMEQRIGDLMRVQTEMTGRVQTMGDMLAGRQSDLARVLGERLDAVTHRVGQSMESSTRTTTDNLRHLYERLAVIDGAQKNLTELTSQVTSLRDVLSNKQARGAFGQARMEAIVQDGLPKGAYEFQFTLSNRLRPDCCVFLPDKRPLVIDAKFPLEAVTALRDAKNDDERKRAAQRVRQDVGRHVSDIAEKYLIPGETQELALMFVPAESVYAELHDGFDDVIQKAYRARVVVVSPSLLMLAIQVIQQIQKDARIREAAHQIQTEVTLLMDDVGRLRERVVKLERHFSQANDDVRQIIISADKIEKRGERIGALEFAEEEQQPAMGVVIPAPITRKLQAGE